jgi:hypothetical protein
MFAGITKKQAGAIFGAWKRGELEATEAQIDMMYFRFVDLGYETTDAHDLDCASKLRNVVDAVFAKDGSATKAFADFISTYKMFNDDKMFAL